MFDTYDVKMIVNFLNYSLIEISLFERSLIIILILNLLCLNDALLKHQSSNNAG